MITLYGIRNCNAIRKAHCRLEANNIDYRLHDYRVDGLDNELLNGFISELSWEALLNTRGTTWRKLDEITCNKIADAASVATSVTETPAIIKRPLLCTSDKPVLLGFSESSYQRFFHEVQSMSCPVIRLAQQLIRRSSLSPDDAGYQASLIERLQAINLIAERVDFADTQGFQAWCGQGETLTPAGHADTVSLGGTDRWIDPPPEPTIRDSMSFGHDATDMKGLLAAMVITAECFVAQHPNRMGRLAFLIISDEKASTHNGAVEVIKALVARNERLDYCLVGELSSIEVVGDVMKNGRRGSLTYNLTTHGVQGHIAYPHLAGDPVHRAAPFTNELMATEQNQGSKFFLATSMQITNTQTGTGGNNVIPGKLFVQFSFRFSTELTGEMTEAQMLILFEKHQLCYTVDWWLSGQPFLTVCGKLVDTVVNAAEHYSEIRPQLLAIGGTLNGRFIARMRVQMVELGPINATIHKINEYVNATDLQLLTCMYQRIMEQLVT